MRTSNEKGILLEKIVESLCGVYGESKVDRNVIIKGKSGVKRQIDVLIQSKYKSFDFLIIVESKNYSRKVDIDIIEAFKTKINDVGGNLGIVVCPLGFTSGAIKSAEQHDIQLFQVFDHQLKNTTQFIPFRYVIPKIGQYQVRIKSEALGNQFSLPTDLTKWCICIENKFFSIKETIVYAWNSGKLPQRRGEHLIDFGVVKIADEDDITRFYYIELEVMVTVEADYYLKLLPASYMKNIKSGKGNHQIAIDAYSKSEDMLKNGWKHFSTKQAMDDYALPYDTSTDMSGLIGFEEYKILN